MTPPSQKGHRGRGLLRSRRGITRIGNLLGPFDALVRALTPIFIGMTELVDDGRSIPSLGPRAKDRGPVLLEHLPAQNLGEEVCRVKANANRNTIRTSNWPSDVAARTRKLCMA